MFDLDQRPTSPAIAEATATHRTTTRRTAMKVRIGFAGLLAAIVLSTGGLGGPPPADAASGVSYCFRYAANLGGSAVVASRYPQYGSYELAYLEAYFSDGWKPVGTPTANLNGCGSFSIWGSLQNLSVRVSWISKIGNAWYTGTTPLYANPGGAAPFLGTGIVYRVR